MSIGKTAAKAAGVAAGAVGDIVGVNQTGLPESEYALAAYLFEKILSAEKSKQKPERSYYTQLMYECLRTIRAANTADKG